MKLKVKAGVQIVLKFREILWYFNANYISPCIRVRPGADLQRRFGAGKSPFSRGVFAASAIRLRPARRISVEAETTAAAHRHWHGHYLRIYLLIYS